VKIFYHDHTPAGLIARAAISVAGVIGVTLAAHRFVTVNATTIAFAYLVLILLIASVWGFAEAAAASVTATLTFNFFFLPPLGTFTIADPENWVALFSFLITSLVASRLSTTARDRAREAIEHQQDVERLYSFSRAILLIDSANTFAKELAGKVVDIFHLNAAVLFDRRTGEYFRAGPAEFEGLDEQLRYAALNGTAFSDAESSRTITAVRLGSEPIASLALQGARMADSVLQGIANLVAIGLERARAQDLAHQVEAARQSEQLRTTLIDAMAHEFKTPLTSIRAATTSILSSPDQPAETRQELVRIADEEAEHLRRLIDDAVEMARLDTATIEVQLEPSDLEAIVRDVLHAAIKEPDSRPVNVSATVVRVIFLDQRLIKLALKQLIDNALKYSAPDTPLNVMIAAGPDDAATVDVTNFGPAIPDAEQARIFDRFWRSPAVKKQMPGTGLGLSIAHSIARAHNGNLEVRSGGGETTFRLTLPLQGAKLERRAHSGR
jgi:two-component system sensor histidine kinase KdpD